jgi:hypothetical protein
MVSVICVVVMGVMLVSGFVTCGRQCDYRTEGRIQVERHVGIVVGTLRILLCVSFSRATRERDVQEHVLGRRGEDTRASSYVVRGGRRRHLRTCMCMYMYIYSCLSLLLMLFACDGLLHCLQDACHTFRHDTHSRRVLVVRIMYTV